MQVPFVDLHAQYLTIKSEIDHAISTVIAETSFISGKHATAFENGFLNYVGTKYCVACANGTDALEIGLQAMGIGNGDEVIVPALSWISTAEALATVGAKPVFVDVKEDGTIDTSLIESKISDKTKAIIPVHLYGNPADMDLLMEIARKHGLKVLEDCAQAHGAELDGKRVGTWGDMATFSFYPGKNLGAYGDAGGMVTNDAALAEKFRMIANHGQQGKHNHLMEGRNSRLDGMQGAILNAKLPHIEKWTEARIRIGQRYDELLASSEVGVPTSDARKRHVKHLYIVKHARRDHLKAFLDSKGVSTAIHYPTPMPLMPAYAHQGHSAADFPVAKQNCDSILSIPIYPELSAEQQDYVVACISEWAQNLG